MDITGFVIQLKRQLMHEFRMHDRNGIYAMTQKSMAYNSNRIEGSTLSSRQTAEIFDTGTISVAQDFVFKTKDVEEMTGHFKMFNEVMKNMDNPITVDMIKEFHYQLKAGVFEDYANGYPVGEFKNRANQVSDITTVKPEDVPAEIEKLLSWWNECDGTLEDIARFHERYEKIHPFQDGNGRTGRAIILKQCLEHNLLPVIIYDDDKIKYYRALSAAHHEGDFIPLVDFFREEQEKYYQQIKDYIVMPTESSAKVSGQMEEFIEALDNKLPDTITCTACTVGDTVRCIIKSEDLSIGLDFMNGTITVAKNNRIIQRDDMTDALQADDKELIDMVLSFLSEYMAERNNFTFGQSSHAPEWI